jgi:hypothetical protein
MTRIIVEDAFTPEQLALETMLVTGRRKHTVTLAGFVSLIGVNSPYITGKEIFEVDRRLAITTLGIPKRMTDMGEEVLDDFIRSELEAVFRAFGIIVSAPQSTGQKSDMPPFGPEWITNIMAAAADALPSLTADDILNKLPLVLIAHLAAASHRRNGGVTRRPSNAMKALEQLEKMKNEPKREGQN